MPSNVTFEFYWKGPYINTDFGTWEVSALDIKLKGTEREIESRINTEIPPTNLQHLTLTISDKKPEGAVLWRPTYSKFETFHCPIEMAKTMQITARMFQVKTDRSRGTMNSDGRISYAQYASRTDFHVGITKTELKEGETYKVTVVHKDNTLKATVEQKTTQEEISERQSLISKLEGEITELKQKRNESVTKLNTSFRHLDRYKIILLESQLRKDAAMIPKLKEELYQARAELREFVLKNEHFCISILERNLAELEKDRETFQAELRGIDEDVNESQKRIITVLESTISKLKEELDQARAELGNFVIKNQHSRIAELERDIAELEKDRKTFQDQLKTLTQYLDKISMNLLQRPLQQMESIISTHKQKLDQAKTELDALKTKTPLSEDEIAERAHGNENETQQPVLEECEDNNPAISSPSEETHDQFLDNTESAESSKTSLPTESNSSSSETEIPEQSDCNLL